MSFELEKPTLLLTVDVEDNFTYEELAYPLDWQKYDGQVVSNVLKVLELFELNANKATFFLVAKVAERHPQIVHEIDSSGHEIATHGYSHEPIQKLGKKGFKEDLKRSINVLEDIVGHKIRGHRARSCLISNKTLWALDIIEELGLEYDSSIFSTRLNSMGLNFYSILQFSGKKILEIPIPSIRILRRDFPLFGGLLLRILPTSFQIKTINLFFKKHGCFSLLSHVWEFNKDQPKRNVGLLQSIAQSPITFTTPQKLKKLSKTLHFTSIKSFLRTTIAT